MDIEEDSESKPAGIEEVRANPDDEWPEEDVKPKKGKKGKKAKKQQVDEDEDEEVAEVEAEPVEEEKPVEKAKPAEKDKPAEEEVEDKDSDDEGPKVGLLLSLVVILIK